MALAEPPEVFCHRVLVALGNAVGITTADLPGLLGIEVTAQLQLELIDIGKQLGTKLVDERRVARKIPGSQALYLPDQLLNIGQ